MQRLPIRLRVTLTFVAMIAVVLAVLGVYLFATLRKDLSRSVDDGLQARAADIVALLARTDSGLGRPGESPLTQSGEGFAQVLSADGRVVDGAPQLRRASLLDAGQRRRALDGVITLDAQAPTVRELGALLLLGLPVALLVAGGAGYAATSQALRPVESMRRRAGEISAGDTGVRLPLPQAEDEVHRLGETLNAMLGRLEDGLSRERRFVTDASHELRTPLSILKAELELALRAGRSPDELREALASAAEETDRLAQLAEDLLVIARSDQGRLPVRSDAVDIDVLLDTVAARFAPRARQAGREVRVVGGGGAVVADPLRLEQAVGNLVDNALRYGAGEVVVSCRRVQGTVELHVRDGGDGFPPGFLATAFDRFTRADHARSRGGAGLGLAIVAAIAAAHGGSAHAANGTGDPPGGDVWLSLPGGHADGGPSAVSGA